MSEKTSLALIIGPILLVFSALGSIAYMMHVDNMKITVEKINDAVSIRCIKGYKFVTSTTGIAQMFGIVDGKTVPLQCDQTKEKQ